MSESFPYVQIISQMTDQRPTETETDPMRCDSKTINKIIYSNMAERKKIEKCEEKRECV